ncbi:MAG: alpha-galactosidase [Clostridiales bacterium]|nr:alpha-galactosidase [Clostridiales bacterium]
MIQYDEAHHIFKLDTPNTSYVFGLTDESYPGQIYYGKKIKDTDLGYLLREDERPQPPSILRREKAGYFDFYPMEYPSVGIGDARESCIGIRTMDGQEGLELRYRSHRIYAGKRPLEGLPATWDAASAAHSDASSDDVHTTGQKDKEAVQTAQTASCSCSTLEMTMEDEVTGLQVVLSYTAFEDVDAITRSVRVENGGERSVYLTKVLSACLHVEQENLEVLTLPGSWSRERQIQRQKLGYGSVVTESIRGISSHQDHPFMALVTENCTQTTGDVYAMNFVYSGNFLAKAMRDQFDQTRMVMGIHPDRFCWKLEPGESFQAPEVVLVYSDEGLGKMTRAFHRLYRNHLIRGYWKERRRPVLINNWEATYFDFDTEKLLAIAREAAERGIEMLVVDDGWFGYRSNDDSSLGDWQVNEKKLPGGFAYLAQEVNKLGMKLGIWLEPEMVSEDSNLYRAHPDWALQMNGREPGQARAQYVLDLSRPEVAEYVYGMIRDVLSSANIEYVKWDMNRLLSDVGNLTLPADRQGEIMHRYMLAVYGLQDRLTKDFPQLLLENCCSGGGRFDPGMLYYSPQIWCSDDTDAIERLSIQEGTQLLYPLSCIGAHVSICPNHGTGRVTPFETRGVVALSGTFGYELDITRLPDEEKDQIPGQVAHYKQFSHLIRNGEYYRIASWRENHLYDCFMVVSEDRTEALCTYVQVLSQINYKSRRIRLLGLDPDAYYSVTEVSLAETCAEIQGQTAGNEAAASGGDSTERDSGDIAAADCGNAVAKKCYQGSALMYAGILMPRVMGDFQTRLLHIKKI